MRVRTVIPTRNEAHRLGPTLAGLAAQTRPTDVVVVDGGSTDGTAAVAAEWGARFMAAPRGRGTQLARGAALPGAPEFLLFLHADTRLPRDGIARIEAALADPGVVGGKFRVRYEGDHPVLRLLERLARSPHPLCTYGDQALFARTSAYRAAGGFEEVPLFEDVRFYPRLRRAGRVRVLDAEVVTSGERFRRHGPLRLTVRNGGLLLRHALGADPADLARRYGEP